MRILFKTFIVASCLSFIALHSFAGDHRKNHRRGDSFGSMEGRFETRMASDKELDNPSFFLKSGEKAMDSKAATRSTEVVPPTSLFTPRVPDPLPHLSINPPQTRVEPFITNPPILNPLTPVTKTIVTAPKADPSLIPHDPPARPSPTIAPPFIPPQPTPAIPSKR